MDPGTHRPATLPYLVSLGPVRGIVSENEMGRCPLPYTHRVTGDTGVIKDSSFLEQWGHWFDPTLTLKNKSRGVLKFYRGGGNSGTHP